MNNYTSLISAKNQIDYDLGNNVTNAAMKLIGIYIGIRLILMHRI